MLADADYQGTGLFISHRRRASQVELPACKQRYATARRHVCASSRSGCRRDSRTGSRWVDGSVRLARVSGLGRG